MTEDVVFQSLQTDVPQSICKTSSNATRERSVSNPKWGTFMHLNAENRQKNQATAGFPIFVTVISSEGVCACGQSPSTQTRQRSESNRIRARWFHGLRCVSQTDLQQLLEDRNGNASMSPVKPEIFLKAQPTSGSIEDNQHWFAFRCLCTRRANSFQSEYELDSNGKEIFATLAPWSGLSELGRTGSAAFVRQGDYVFQAPLSFYSKAQRWELSPGYELGNSGFNRPILPAASLATAGGPMPSPRQRSFCQSAIFRTGDRLRELPRSRLTQRARTFRWIRKQSGADSSS